MENTYEDSVERVASTSLSQQLERTPPPGQERYSGEHSQGKESPNQGLIRDSSAGEYQDDHYGQRAMMNITDADGGGG